MIQRCQGAVRRHVQGRASGAFYVSPAGGFGTRPLRRVQRHAAAAPSRRDDHNRGRSAALSELLSCRDERRMSKINDSGSGNAARPRFRGSADPPRAASIAARALPPMQSPHSPPCGSGGSPKRNTNSDGAGWAPCSRTNESAREHDRRWRRLSHYVRCARRERQQQQSSVADGWRAVGEGRSSVNLRSRALWRCCDLFSATSRLNWPVEEKSRE